MADFEAATAEQTSGGFGSFNRRQFVFGGECRDDFASAHGLFVHQHHNAFVESLRSQELGHEYH